MSFLRTRHKRGGNGLVALARVQGRRRHEPQIIGLRAVVQWLKLKLKRRTR